jgi:hypothetical protein
LTLSNSSLFLASLVQLISFLLQYHIYCISMQIFNHNPIFICWQFLISAIYKWHFHQRVINPRGSCYGLCLRYGGQFYEIWV